MIQKPLIFLSLIFPLAIGSGSSYGTFFKISTFGESHGGGVGVIVDGCPPRIPLSNEDIQVKIYFPFWGPLLLLIFIIF